MELEIEFFHLILSLGSELKRIESVASKLNINASISIRFNPEVDSGDMTILQPEGREISLEFLS